MTVFVDGADLLDFLERSGSSLLQSTEAERKRMSLARWLAQYADAQDCDVRLVFADLPTDQVFPPRKRCGAVCIRYLEAGETARQEIAGPANRAAKSGERVYVVTSDPRLQDALLRGKARVFEPPEFVSRASRMLRHKSDAADNEPREKRSGLSDQQVSFWKDLFDDEL